MTGHPHTASRRRVLHVLASNDRRGAEVFAVDLAGALEPLGFESSLISLRRSTSSATVPAAPIGSSGRVATARSLRRLAENHDVVIAHGSTSLPACAMACAGVAPFLYRSIGDPAYWSSTTVKRVRTKLLLDRAHAVVCLFEAAATTLRERKVKASLAVIPNAVRAEEFPRVNPTTRQSARDELGIEHDQQVALYLGALSTEKRPDRAVALATARPELQVILVGDGPVRAELEDRARHVPNVVVHGPTSSPHRHLLASDVVIIPSDTEGIPAVAIEAGFTGLPVVASDVGGLSAVVEHGTTGMLVPAGDDVAFADAVDLALADGQALGAAARARCQAAFDLDVVAQQWAQVIERAVRPTTGT